MYVIFSPLTENVFDSELNSKLSSVLRCVVYK